MFYLGTLLSSVGSMTFTLSAVTFMLRRGHGIADVSLLVGLSRLLPLVTTALLGDLADRRSPKEVVLASEVLAVLFTLGILWSWSLGPGAFVLFVGLVVARSCVLSVQTGGRAKIAKILSDSSIGSNSKNAIWLNKVTQGSTLFAGILGWIVAKHFTFESVIVFDALTFLLNGLILWKIFVGKAVLNQNLQDGSGNFRFLEKFSNLYKYSSRVAKLDLILAVVMSGFWSFSTRMAVSSHLEPAIFLVSFGGAVWISGFAERIFPGAVTNKVLWLLIGIVLAGAGAFSENPAFVIVFIFLRDLSYWTIFHRFTSQIQFNTPVKYVAGVASARFVQMVATLSFGEFLVGSWQGFLSVSQECFLRASVCGCVFVWMVWSKSASETSEVNCDSAIG